MRHTHLRSSSKCVSMPLTPGTEHMSRALRKVVHLFTRLLWPPMSFWSSKTWKKHQYVSTHGGRAVHTCDTGRGFALCVCCYLTQLSYPGDGGLARVLSVHGVLLEKQEDLVVFGVVALWDQVHTYEPGVWRKKKEWKKANLTQEPHCAQFVHTRLKLSQMSFFTIQTSGNPLTPTLHLRNQSPMIFSSHGSVITSIHFTPCCHSIWLYPERALQKSKSPLDHILANTHGYDCPGEHVNTFIST